MMTHDGLAIIEQDIKKMIEAHLERAGILYRIYSRIKSKNSIHEKITRKGYFTNGKLMQDVIGLRIMTYFGEDVELLVRYFSSFFDLEYLQYDEPEVNQFNPVRINLLCRLKQEQQELFNQYTPRLTHLHTYMDATFEIQIRTMFSEGWHEIDHFMRYKCKEEWKDLENESRLLNGIYATLDTTDQTMIRLFDEMAYQHYQNRNWVAMLRNRFRLKFDPEPLSPAIHSLFNQNKELAKSFLKLDRNEAVHALLKSNISMPITFSNWIYFCNYLYVRDEYIHEQMPLTLLSRLEASFTEKRLYQVVYKTAK